MKAGERKLEQRKKILETWIDLYGHRLVRLAYTYVQDSATAEDRVQDAFIKVYGQFNKFKDGSDPFPWLARIVINECKMAYRSNWREIVSSMLPEKEVVSSEDEFLSMEADEMLYALILKLPEPYRIAIVLYYFEELSVQKIAAILGKREGTIKSRLSRGRHRLRKFWKERDTYETAIQNC